MKSLIKLLSNVKAIREEIDNITANTYLDKYKGKNKATIAYLTPFVIGTAMNIGLGVFLKHKGFGKCSKVMFGLTAFGLTVEAGRIKRTVKLIRKD